MQSLTYAEIKPAKAEKAKSNIKGFWVILLQAWLGQKCTSNRMQGYDNDSAKGIPYFL